MTMMDYISIKKIFALLFSAMAVFSSCGETVQVEPEIEVTPEPDVKYSEFKVISYNILEGMKNDKAANYDNFVAWVQKQNPDVLALQECNGFTPEFLAKLAKRWGHDYVALKLHDGYYPVSMTSKYPIEVKKYMQDTGKGELWHNAIHAKVKGVNVVILHLYPFSKYPNESSSEVGSGEAYRIKEMNYILDSTMRKYPTEPDWLMMGDFNSFSPLDKEEYGDGRYYDLHTLVLENGYYDVIREHHNYFINSTKSSRIDFIYSSKSVLKDITEANIIKDDFTTMQVADGGDGAQQVSDHYPVSVVFRYLNN